MSSRSSHDEVVAALLAQLDVEDMAETLSSMVDIPSPTGGERPLAQWIAQRLERFGVAGIEQVIDDRQANAVGVLMGAGEGPSTMLYAPIDTFTVGSDDYDTPWAAQRLPDSMKPKATRDGPLITGLAASNPKGHAACVLHAVAAFAQAGIEFDGQILAGFGAGGMPSFSIDGIGVEGRRNTGHGVGAIFMLERGFYPDQAIIAKPGWAVSHEEVGLVWIDVIAPGTHSYAGSRESMPYLNAAEVAAQVISQVEAWLPEYADRSEANSLRPQGVVSSVHGGSEWLGASTPASVRVRLDVRMTPEQSAPDVVRAVRRALAPVRERLGVDMEVRQVACVPGTRTDPQATVVQATIRAWEETAGHRHEIIRRVSGATDANIFRLRRVPTARVGMPKVSKGAGGVPVDFSLGMNTVDVREMRRLTEVLIRSLVKLNVVDRGTARIGRQ